MKLEISVPEVVDIFKEIQEQPEQLYEMIRADIRETIGQYLSGLMDAELTHFLGRKPYERLKGGVNNRTEPQTLQGKSGMLLPVETVASV